MDSLLIIVASATGAAVVKLLDGIIQWCLQRKAKHEDDKTASNEELEKVVESLRKGMKVMMLERIQYLCKCYIHDGEIDFDDRRRLHIMHDVYHNELEGNGDLDILMRDVDELPLKGEK